MLLPKKIRKVDRKLLDRVASQPCCICGTIRNVDPSHIKTRGSGGPDEPWNVVPKCRTHHIEWGTSWSRFIARHPHFGEKLKRMGWTWDNGKLWNPRLSCDDPGDP